MVDQVALPSEIIQAILRQIDYKDLLQSSLVCKKWAFLALEILWNKPILHGHSQHNNNHQAAYLSTPKSMDFFSLIQASAPPYQHTTYPYALFVRRVNLALLSGSIEDLHVMSLRYCTRLVRLTLAGCSKVTDRGLYTLFHHIGKELMSLDLTDVYQITDTTVTAVADSCRALQALSLSMGKAQLSITDRSILRLAVNCRDLKRIKLNNCINITDAAAIALSRHCAKLVEIDLMNCRVTNQALISIFSHNLRMKELRVNQGEQKEICIDDAAFTKSRLIDFGRYEQLRLVDFGGLSTITDKTLDILTKSSPKLRSLLLNKCSQITDEGILAICRLGRYLHFLHLGHCLQLTDTSIATLTKHCHRLRYLDLTACAQITDTSIFAVAKNLHKLKRIGLVKCSLLTDDAIVAMASQKSIAHSLERIHLSYCVNLSLNAVTCLLNACQKINHISLTHVPSFLREDIQAFCRAPLEEFTSSQRRVFCVFTGRGVLEVRCYLNLLIGASVMTPVQYLVYRNSGYTSMEVDS